jgi:hypothetical protein
VEKPKETCELLESRQQPFHEITCGALRVYGINLPNQGSRTLPCKNKKDPPCIKKDDPPACDKSCESLYPFWSQLELEDSSEPEEPEVDLEARQQLHDVKPSSTVWVDGIIGECLQSPSHQKQEEAVHRKRKEAVPHQHEEDCRQKQEEAGARQKQDKAVLSQKQKEAVPCQKQEEAVPSQKKEEQELNESDPTEAPGAFAVSVLGRQVERQVPWRSRDIVLPALFSEDREDEKQEESLDWEAALTRCQLDSGNRESRQQQRESPQQQRDEVRPRTEVVGWDEGVVQAREVEVVSGSNEQLIRDFLLFMQRNAVQAEPVVSEPLLPQTRNSRRWLRLLRWRSRG